MRSKIKVFEELILQFLVFFRNLGDCVYIIFFVHYSTSSQILIVLQIISTSMQYSYAVPVVGTILPAPVSEPY